MEELITVIIPIYNEEKYLSKCIDSIITQTYKNLEIILIEVGSEDSSGKICDEYKTKDNRIKVIHKNKLKVGAARNEGLKIAKGKYIAFVDSDDYINKNYIEKLYQTLKKEKVECVLCGFNRVYENHNEIVTKGKEIKLNKYEFLSDILNVQGGAGIVHTKLWKKEVVEKIEFNENLEIAEDSLFCIQTVKNIDNVYILNEPLYNYRFNSESAVRKYKPNFPEICLEAMQEAKEYIEKEYSNNEKILKKFNNYIAYHILLITVNYCFNNDNHLNNKEQIKSLKNVCNIPIYKQGIKGANYEGLSTTRKITLFTIKHKLYFITMLIGKIRQAQFKK